MKLEQRRESSDRELTNQNSLLLKIEANDNSSLDKLKNELLEQEFNKIEADYNRELNEMKQKKICWKKI